MIKHKSEDAYYERIRNLAEVNKKSIKESQNRTLGTLIDYQRAGDGIAYGIVKENHQYYIKKSGIKQNPDVTDFAYIGGLGNITDFQYKSLSEATKQRNMIFHTINESIMQKPIKNGNKLKLNEGVADIEIKNAENKLNDLDAATNANQSELDGDSEMSAGIDAMPTDGESDESPINSPEDGETTNDDTENELPIESPEGGETTNDGESDTIKEIEKSLGKLTNKLRQTELTDPQIKSYVNSFLAAFKDKFPDIEIEDRKAMADKITKVVPDEEIADLGQNVEDTTNNTELDEECSECGGFAQYAKSRGYDSADALMECDEEEVSNLVSGYANAHNDGMNDGDHENVALVIKLINPEMINTLKNDYGHDDYADKLSPYLNNMNESDDDSIVKLNELFGGLKNVGKAAISSIGSGLKNVGTDISNASKDIYQAGVQKAGQVKQAVGQAADTIKQTYHQGEVNPEIKKLEQNANALGQQIVALNQRLIKAGQEPINVGGVLAGITNQIKSGGNANISKIKAGSNIQRENIDPANIEIQPITEDDNVDDLGNNDVKFAADSQPIGVGVVKPNGAPTTGVDVTVDGQNKSINIAMNEIVEKLMTSINELSKKVNEDKPSAGLSKEKKSEIVKKAKAGEDIGKKGKGFDVVAKKAAKKYGSAEKGEKVAAAAMWKNIKKEGKDVDNVMSESENKLRKYIRNRLEEHAGIKKPILTENKKSDTLMKLDAIIDKQFKLHESLVQKKSENLNEILGFSAKEKFTKLNANDEVGINELFNNIFSTILNNKSFGGVSRAANRTPFKIKYEILKQYFINNGGTLRTTPEGILQYASKEIKSKATPSQFAGGGTGGKTFNGGV